MYQVNDSRDENSARVIERLGEVEQAGAESRVDEKKDGKVPRYAAVVGRARAHDRVRVE